MNSGLNRLARLYGIQTSYIGATGQKVQASAESLLRVLAALGAPVRRMDDVPRALSQRQLKLRDESPVIIAWNGRFDPGAVKPRLFSEDGVEVNWVGRKLPTGYYRMTAGKRESLVISAPVKAYSPWKDRTWGVFAPMYSLHSRRTRDVADIRDFRTIVEWTSQLGGSVAATLPLLATFLTEPYEPSPYSPASRIFWNELYIDPTGLPEFQDCIDARKQYARLRPPSGHVDYRAAMAHKRSVLEAMSKEFFRRERSTRHDAFERFRRQNPTLEDYAKFRAVTDERGSGWHSWPARLRRGTIRPSDYNRHTWQYHLYAQWIIQEQLDALARDARAAGGMLYLDLPLGLHKESYDTWRYPHFFVDGMTIGAPPDIVFTAGQNWNLPAMHPQMMREDRHEYTIAFIRNHLKYAGLLRIDHVMGLHRFFWIPEGMPTSQGVYVEYPAEEFYAILSVESHRSRAGIVGENLGTVPPVVNSSMKRHNIQQMYILQYELCDSSKGNTPGPPSEGAVAGLNTHDMPPFRAFLEGMDIPLRIRLGAVDKKGAQKERKERAQWKKSLISFLGVKRSTPDNVLRASLRFLATSKARVVLVNLEDLWHEVLPQNIPATGHEQPNWRRLMKYSIERIQKDPRFVRLLRELNRTRK